MGSGIAPGIIRINRKGPADDGEFTATNDAVSVGITLVETCDDTNAVRSR